MQSKSSRVLKMARRVARGVTLIEVLIVVAIIGLIAAGVTVAAFPAFRKAQIDTANTNARSMRQAVAQWRISHGDECPSVSQLQQDKVLDPGAETKDPWGQPYKIQCPGDEVVVSTPGPDKKENTEDDIIQPRPSSGKP